MPLWLDFLRTPMAAPETRVLKVMRMATLAICLSLIVSIAAIGPLKAAIGTGAGALVAGQLLVLIALVPTYWVVKTRADDAWLSHLLEESEQ